MCFAISLFPGRAMPKIFGTKIVPTAPKIHCGSINKKPQALPLEVLKLSEII
jgi:hypothetical protein